MKSTKEFSPSLIVEKAPALRYDHLWNVGGMSFNKKKYNILIGLSIFIEESINILNLVIGAIKNTHLDNYSFKISLHPAVTQKKLLRSFNGNWPESFNIVGGINNLLNTTDLLISGGLSGICLESVSLGIPTIVVENPYGFSCNSIPMDVPNKLWKLCRTSEDIRNSINYFKNITLEQKIENRKLGNKIGESYFEPISKDGIMRFLNLSTKEN